MTILFFFAFLWFFPMGNFLGYCLHTFELKYNISFSKLYSYTEIPSYRPLFKDKWVHLKSKNIPLQINSLSKNQLQWPALPVIPRKIIKKSVFFQQILINFYFFQDQKLLQKSNSMASVTSHSQKNKSSLSLNNHHILNNSINSDSKLRNDTPQSIPLADLDGEMQISNLSLASSKSYSKSLQSIQSYNGSIKVRNIFFIQLRGN